MDGHTHAPIALRFVLTDLQSLVGPRTGMDVVEESINFLLPGIILGRRDLRQSFHFLWLFT